MDSAGREKQRLAARVFNTGLPVVTFIFVAALILLWEYLSQNRLISPLFYPPPTRALKAFVEWFTTDEWQEVLLPTLRRIAIGFCGGAIVGYLVGVVIGYSRAMHRLLDPLISFLHPIPKVSLLPLALVIFGIGDGSRQVIIGVSVFFPMVINTAAGIRTINSNYYAIAVVYGAGIPAIFRRILLPGSLPVVMSALRIAFNTGFVVALAIELASSNDGIGRVIWLAWQTMRTEDLYAGIFLIALLGLFSNVILNWLERRLVRWQP